MYQQKQALHEYQLMNASRNYFCPPRALCIFREMTPWTTFLMLESFTIVTVWKVWNPTRWNVWNWVQMFGRGVKSGRVPPFTENHNPLIHIFWQEMTLTLLCSLSCWFLVDWSLTLVFQSAVSNVGPNEINWLCSAKYKWHIPKLFWPIKSANNSLTLPSWKKCLSVFAMGGTTDKFYHKTQNSWHMCEYSCLARTNLHLESKIITHVLCTCSCQP